MTNLIAFGDSPSENEWLQLAESHKYDSSLLCGIAELRPGIFALYQHATVLYVGEWNEVLTHYQARPIYTPQARPAREFAATRSRGKLSAEEKRANTLALIAKMKGTSNATT